MDRIDSINAVDIGGGKLGFQDEILSVGAGSQEGTWVAAWWLTALQEELMTLIEASGFVGDKTKWNHLLKAVRSQRVNYHLDTGTANAMVITPEPVFEDLTHLIGVPLHIKKGANANGGATTLNVNGLGNIAVKTKTNIALAGAAWPASATDTVIFNGTYFEKQDGNLFASLNPDGSVVQTAPYFRAKGTAGGATYANNVASVSSDMVLQESGFLDAATTFTGGILTIGPKDAGEWQFSANLGINTAVSGWTSKVTLLRNLADNFGYSEPNVYGTAGTGNTSVSGTVRLSAGDTVKAAMLQNTGSNQTSAGAGNFSGARVGK